MRKVRCVGSTSLGQETESSVKTDGEVSTTLSGTTVLMKTSLFTSQDGKRDACPAACVGIENETRRCDVCHTVSTRRLMSILK